MRGTELTDPVAFAGIDRMATCNMTKPPKSKIYYISPAKEITNTATAGSTGLLSPNNEAVISIVPRVNIS